VRTRIDSASAEEARATKDVKGSLEERILYKSLEQWGFIPGIDFTFQTSILGGRAELGGLVADFVFPVPMIIVNPSSVWHTMSLANIRRDDDQTAILASMGYLVIYLDPNIIHDPVALDYWISNNISMLWGTSSQGNGFGNGGVGGMSYINSIEQGMLTDIDQTLDAILKELST
jgi:hypothetical protein